MAITIDGADNKLEIGANATGPSSLRLYEDTDNGTNYVSIIAPSAVTSNRTITLPDATGTILTSATTPGFPAGSVLQVVSSTYSTYTTISSTSFTDTGLSASITPTSASSKILIIVSQQTTVVRNSNTLTAGYTNLVRGSTQIWLGTRNPVLNAGTSTDGNIISGTQQGIIYLDSPATTSLTTYKTQGKISSTTNSGTYRVNDYQDTSGETVSTITLMEIAA